MATIGLAEWAAECKTGSGCQMGRDDEWDSGVGRAKHRRATKALRAYTVSEGSYPSSSVPVVVMGDRPQDALWVSGGKCTQLCR